ncbi:MAG: hypothetical protein HVN35_05155 [Methanobacteriaceae archaeon]|nr:hypothetical protein [Methanobacteriaceae archaeon]
MENIPEAITFEKVKPAIDEITIPEEFIKDFHWSNDNHLMIILRVIGQDSGKVKDFFENSEKDTFILKIIGKSNQSTSEKYVLTSMYLDEGPPISVDINLEMPMVRTILDFKKR